MASPPWLGDRWVIPAGGAGIDPAVALDVGAAVDQRVGAGLWSDPVTWSLGSWIFLFVIDVTPSVVVASTTLMCVPYRLATPIDDAARDRPTVG